MWECTLAKLKLNTESFRIITHKSVTMFNLLATNKPIHGDTANCSSSFFGIKSLFAVARLSQLLEIVLCCQRPFLTCVGIYSIATRYIRVRKVVSPCL